MPRVEDPDPCGDRINDLRDRRGWTLRQLADEAKIPLSTVHRIVVDGQSPRARDLRKFASAFGVNPGSLFRAPRRSREAA
jgi:transcriptional regulator with XRE-family HTH domain